MRLVFVCAEAERFGNREEGVNRRAVQSADAEIDGAESADPNLAEGCFDFLAGHVFVSLVETTLPPSPDTSTHYLRA